MRGALRGSNFGWEGTASMRGAVRGSVKGCCRARRRALRRSLFSLINFLPRTVPRPACFVRGVHSQSQRIAQSQLHEHSGAVADAH